MCCFCYSNLLLDGCMAEGHDSLGGNRIGKHWMGNVLSRVNTCATQKDFQFYKISNQKRLDLLL